MKLNQQEVIKIVLFLTVSVSIPTLISVTVFTTMPTTLHFVLYFLIGLGFVHPYLGLPNVPKILALQLEETNTSQKEPKSDLSDLEEFTEPDIYIDNLDGLRAQIIKHSNLETEPAAKSEGSLWEPVLSQQKNDFAIEVHKGRGKDFLFRVLVDLETTAEEAFDLMADIESRATWDEVTDSAGIIQRISAKTSINVSVINKFMRTKGIWPTAPRSALVMSFTERLEDGRLMNVTKSIDSHPDFTQPAGDVRMLANVAGFVIGPHPSGNLKRCRCIQIIDGDLGGWLPASIVSLVTTQAYPISMRRINSILKKIPEPKTKSKLMEQAEGKTAIQRVEKASTKLVQKSFLATFIRILKDKQPIMVFLIFILVLFRKRQ